LPTKVSNVLASKHKLSCNEFIVSRVGVDSLWNGVTKNMTTTDVIAKIADIAVTAGAAPYAAGFINGMADSTITERAITGWKYIASRTCLPLRLRLRTHVFGSCMHTWRMRVQEVSLELPRSSSTVWPSTLILNGASATGNHSLIHCSPRRPLR